MFKYDVIIEKEDICNYTNEIKQLIKYAQGGEKVVLFAPRRYGKTSILINVVGKEFLRRNKNALFCYVNLQEIKDFDSMATRFFHGLEEAIGRAFPVKTIVSNVVGLMASLRPQVELDPISGKAKLTLSLGKDRRKGLNDIFKTITELAGKYPLLLTIDEFQDIAFLPEAEAIIRQFVQGLANSSVVVSGSKKHILKDIFLDEQRPFYNWGKSVELKRIPFEMWKTYILSRFEKKRITASDDILKYILENVYYVPNYTCRLCSDIFNNYADAQITMRDVESAIHSIYLSTQSRYAEKIAFLTEKQLKLLALIAREGHVSEITATKVATESGISTRGLSKMSKLLLDKGYIEREEAGLRIADPFFAHYLQREF